jgi:hypothetical protein
MVPMLAITDERLDQPAISRPAHAAIEKNRSDNFDVQMAAGKLAFVLEQSAAA